MFFQASNWRIMVKRNQIDQRIYNLSYHQPLSQRDNVQIKSLQVLFPFAVFTFHIFNILYVSYMPCTRILDVMEFFSVKKDQDVVMTKNRAGQTIKLQSVNILCDISFLHLWETFLSPPYSNDEYFVQIFQWENGIVFINLLSLNNTLMTLIISLLQLFNQSLDTYQRHVLLSLRTFVSISFSNSQMSHCRRYAQHCLQRKSPKIIEEWYLLNKIKMNSGKCVIPVLSFHCFSNSIP